jgi:hypothetical protein
MSDPNPTAIIVFPSTKVRSCRILSSRPLADGDERGVSRSGSSGPFVIGSDNRRKSFNIMSCVDIGASHMNLSSENCTYMLSMLNYPSLSIRFPTADSKEKHTCTVTNHGQLDTYVVMSSTAASKTPLIVLVNPSMLTFTKVSEKMSYTVSYSRLDARTNWFSRLVLCRNLHVVASSIVATWILLASDS